MAIGPNITEIPDSEDDPMTSSPVAVSDEAGNELCAATFAPAQDTQDGAVPHLPSTENIARSAPRHTNDLGADQENASVDDADVSQNRHADLQPNVTPQQEGTMDGVFSIGTRPLAEVDTSQRPSMAAQNHRVIIVESDQPSFVPISMPENDSMTRQAQRNIDNIDDSIDVDHVLEVTSNSTEKKLEPPSLLQNIIKSSAHKSEATEISTVPNDNNRAHVADGTKTNDEDENSGVCSELVVYPEPYSSIPFNSPLSQVDVQSALLHHSSTPTELMDGLSSIGSSQVAAMASQLSVADDGQTPAQTADSTPSFAPEPHHDDSMPQSFSLQNSLATRAVELPVPAEMKHYIDLKQSRMSKNDLSNSCVHPSSTVEAAAAHGGPSISSNDPREEGSKTKINGTKMSNDAHENTAGTETQLWRMFGTSHLGPHDEVLHSLSTKRALNDENEKSRADEQQVGYKHEPTAYATSTTAELRTKTATPSGSTESETHSRLAPHENSTETSPNSTPRRTPQEVTIAELKAQRAALLSSLANLPAIQVLMEENDASAVDLSDDDGEPTDADIMAAANKIVKDHIKLLHEYNELKDVGQGLMGLIADQRGVRIVEIQDEFGIDAKD